MQISRFSDILGFRSRNRTVAALKSQMDVTAREAVTGLKTDLTLATNGRVGTAHLMQKALNDISQNQRISALSGARLELTSQAVSGARQALNNLDTKAIIALESGSVKTMGVVAEEARANLSSVMAALSLKQGTRNLLSGTATDRPPFADPSVLLADIEGILNNAGSSEDIELALDSYFDDPAGGFNTKIYQGGKTPSPALRIGENETLALDIRGNHEAIKQTLRGLAVMAIAPVSTLSEEAATAVMRGGISQAAEGNSGLINLEADLGILSETLKKSDARSTVEQLSLNSAYQRLVGRDQFEAAAELKQLEVALESSYIISSRLSGLSLSNYLR